MARPLRLEIPDGTFHVWNRGVNRTDLGFDDGDRERFFDLLPEVVRRFGWIIHQFMLMTNPFHLIVSTPVGQILIGSAAWVESMRRVIEAKPRSTDHPAMQRYAARPRPAKIVDVVAGSVRDHGRGDPEQP